MKKLNLLKSLILVTSVLSCTVQAFGYAEVEQAVTLSVQPTVSIEKVVSNETGFIDAATGIHSGLSASFLIQTNGTDEDYDFIILSKINTQNGEVSAFGKNGCLLFTNTASLPTNSAVENARVGAVGNNNVIAYPLTVSITTPMSVNYFENSSYGDCYVMKVNSTNEGTLTQTVEGSPIANTYMLGQDEAGTYQATVYFTTVSK